METIGQRIKRLREKLEISQADLAQRAGWDSQSRIGNYETGIRKVSVEDAIILAKALNVSPGELILGEMDNATFSNVGERRIPVISYIQAGAFSIPDYIKTFEGAEEYIVYDGSISDCAFSLRLKGDSMEPEFKAGDTVIIDPMVAPNPGEFVIAKNGDEEGTFKKYRPKANGAFELVPLNPDYPIIDSEQHEVHIIGTMVEHRIHRRKR